ncbi:MAG: OmpH family outer membrane protein [Candidatus Aminicenantia bacterium]
MKKFKNLAIIFTLSVFLVPFLLAQETLKIGVVDAQKILETSNSGKQAIAKITARNKKIQDELAKRDKEISDLENKLTTQRLTLSSEAQEKLMLDLEKKRTDRKRFWEDSMREIQNLRTSLFKKIQDEVVPIIIQLGKEKGYTLIIDLFQSGAIYWDNSIDITDEVIKRYNQSKAKPKGK